MLKRAVSGSDPTNPSNDYHRLSPPTGLPTCHTDSTTTAVQSTTRHAPLKHPNRHKQPYCRVEGRGVGVERQSKTSTTMARGEMEDEEEDDEPEEEEGEEENVPEEDG